MRSIRRFGLAAVSLTTALVSGCSSGNESTAADDGSPCGIADRAAVERLIGGPTTVAASTSEMSGDGAGQVTNCVLRSEDESKAVGFVQRLGFGRAEFDASRAALGQTVSVGASGYWVAERSQLFELDGDDLVAIRFSGFDGDVEDATALMATAVLRRHR